MQETIQEKDGLTPLHLAVYHGHVKCVKLLIDHGADVNCTSNSVCVMQTLCAVLTYSIL